MSANFEAKKEQVAQISEKIGKAQSIVIVDYKGLTVAEDTELRRSFRAAGVEYKVIKNALFARALAENNIEGLDEHLKLSSAFAFSYDDPVAGAKVIDEFAKKNDKLKVKAGIVDGQAVDAAGVKALAALPSKEVLIATVLGTLNAPITGFVRVLNGTLTSLLYALNAVKDQKEQAK